MDRHGSWNDWNEEGQADKKSVEEGRTEYGKMRNRRGREGL